MLAPEQKRLLVIFIIFEVSYLARATFDLFISSIINSLEELQSEAYLYIILILLSFTFIDGLPLFSLLWYHLQNFVIKPK